METTPDAELDALRPGLRDLARRLIRLYQGVIIEAEDLVAIACVELWEKRDEVAASPDPEQTAYRKARRVMWQAVQSANRRPV